VAVGFTVVLIAGYLDLSVGSVINLGAVMVIAVGNKAGLVPGILAAVAAGMLVGLVNGLFVTKGKIHAFIVTLGMLTTVKGLLYMITGSASINTGKS
jgi:ribose/xylose/arabinose/galactoside ABC-type transport system permease subunit